MVLFVERLEIFFKTAAEVGSQEAGAEV